jgi:hypothetical protein
MNKKPNPELRDADNPAWTAADMKAAVALSGLPASLQTKLRGRPKADVRRVKAGKPASMTPCGHRCNWLVG